MNISEETSSLLEKLENEPYVSSLDGSTLTFLEITGNGGPLKDDVIQDEWQRLHLLAKMVPTIGVVGGNNAGKTTLVRRFLSENNHERALVGDHVSEGTNRFIVWAPESWGADPEKKLWLKNWIGTAFGHEPEDLPLDPEAAKSAIFSMDDQGIQLDTPLLAFDSKLETLNLAVLDCPDMEVPHGRLAEKVEDSTAIRKKALARASRICSAFFMVQNVDRLRAENMKEMLQKILDFANRPLPVYFVVSRTRVQKDSSFDWRSDLETLLSRYGVSSCIHKTLHSPFVKVLKDETVRYYDLSNNPVDLATECSELSDCRTKVGKVANGLGELCVSMAKVNGSLQENARKGQNTERQVQKAILRFLEDHFLDEDRLRNIYTPKASRNLFQAFYNTSPRLIRINLAPIKFIKKANSLFSNIMDPAKLARKEVEGIIHRRGIRDPKIQKELVSEKDFLKAMRDCEEIRLAEEDNVKKIWNKTFLYLQDRCYLDVEPNLEDLEKAFREVWEKISRKETIKITMVSFLTLLLVILALFVEAITFTGGHAVVAAASLAEILTAFGIGGGLALFSTPRSTKLFKDQVARPQLSRLFSVLQDGFGIQRATKKTLASFSENRYLELEVVPMGEVEKMPAVLPLLKDTLSLTEQGLALMQQADSLYQSYKRSAE